MSPKENESKQTDFRKTPSFPTYYADPFDKVLRRVSARFKHQSQQPLTPYGELSKLLTRRPRRISRSYALLFGCAIAILFSLSLGIPEDSTVFALASALSPSLLIVSGTVVIVGMSRARDYPAQVLVLCQLIARGRDKLWPKDEIDIFMQAEDTVREYGAWRTAEVIRSLRLGLVLDSRDNQ